MLDTLELLSGDGTYRLRREFDLGTGEPETLEVVSRFLDGDLVQGDRTRNRTVRLPVRVVAETGDALRAAVGALAAVVDRRSFTLTWTPDGGLPMVLDCFRGSCTPVWDNLAAQDGWAQVVLEFPALPFGRTPEPLTIAGSGSQVQIDAMETAATGGTQNTSVKYEGAASNNVTFTFTSSTVSDTKTLSRTVSSKNLTGQSVLRLRARVTHTVAPGWMQVWSRVRLDSAAGSSWFTPEEPAAAFQPQDELFYAITYRLSTATVASGAGVDLSAVTGWAVEAHLRAAYALNSSQTVQIDDLRAMPGGSASLQATARGAVYTLPGVLGTARAPMNVQLSRGGGMQDALVHRPPPQTSPDARLLIELDSTNTTSKSYAVAAPAPYAGTYAVVLAVNAYGASSALHTVDVLFTQGVGATTVESNHRVRRQFYTADMDGRLLHVGFVTLPLVTAADDGSSISYTITVNSDQLDSFTDLMLLDTRGQTVIAMPTGAFAFLYIDEPKAGTVLGPVLASPTNRAGAFSVLRQGIASGGPLSLDPGSNRLLVLSPEGSPSVQVTYSPRWLTERSE